MSNNDSGSSRSKVRFKPVKEPPQPASPRLPTPSPPTPLALRALAPGEAPRAPGLARDAHGFIVGAQGLVAVQGAGRLNAFLAALSQVVDLARGVAVESHTDGLFLVVLAPGETGEPLSQFYDTVQGALASARLGAGRARLFVGGGRVFVPYADPAAPHGFDADGDPPGEGRALLRPGEAPLLLAERPTGSLLEALLSVPLQPAPQSPATTLSLLTDRRLAALIAGYVQRHGLACSARFLTWRQGERAAEVALFDIVTADVVRPVPGFVCDFLGWLPHTVLLSDALEPADLESEPARRVLLPRGQRASLHLPHVQELLPAHSLLIIAGAPWGAALIAAPPPRAMMQRLTEATISAPATAALSAQPQGRLRLRLELRRDGPARGPIHGLLLDAAALARLCRIARHLPAPLFAHARIALGEEVALVLAADDAELAGLPLGQPLARAEPPILLLPRGTRLLPTLPQDLLAPALGLRSETLTVLTPTSRYEVEPAALQPLSSLFSLDPPARTGVITVRPSQLPPLDLSDLEQLPQPPLAPAPEQKKPGLPERLRSITLAPWLAGGDFHAELRRRAAELERRGELELAAAFYTYLQDQRRAASCYQRLIENSR